MTASRSPAGDAPNFGGARTAEFVDGETVVRVESGVEVRFPVARNPRLAKGNPGQLNNIEISPFGLHRPDLDEDLSFQRHGRGRLRPAPEGIVANKARLAAPSLAESNPRAFACLLCLNRAISWRRNRLKRVDQRPRDLRDIAHGLVKSRFIGMRGLVEAAYFTDKLKRSSVDFRVRGGGLEIEKRSNIPAHAHKHGAGTASVKRSG